ncbi:hypothetical protein Tco_0055072 [Tanacetum coccineum]
MPFPSEEEFERLLALPPLPPPLPLISLSPKQPRDVWVDPFEGYFAVLHDIDCTGFITTGTIISSIRTDSASTAVGLVFSFLVSDNHNNMPPRRSSATARAAAAAARAVAAAVAVVPMTAAAVK